MDREFPSLRCAVNDDHVRQKASMSLPLPLKMCLARRYKGRGAVSALHFCYFLHIYHYCMQSYREYTSGDSPQQRSQSRRTRAGGVAGGATRPFSLSLFCLRLGINQYSISFGSAFCARFVSWSCVAKIERKTMGWMQRTRISQGDSLQAQSTI